MTDIQKENKSGGKVPNLRFPEFKEGWEVKKLGEICEMRAGKFIVASEIYDKPNDSLFPCFGGNGLRGYTKSFNKEGTYSLIGRQGALCGNVTLANGKFYATEHAVIVEPNENADTIWMFYLLTYLNLNQYATGMAQPGLSVQNLEKIEIVFPKSKKEQQKTASFLSKIDERIRTQNKILIHLKSLIESLNDSLSEQKIRINSNFENWKKVRLGDLGYTFTGLSGKTKEDFGNGKRYIQYKQIFDSSKIAIENCGYVNVSENENQNSVKYGDIFFTISSETPDEIGMSSVLLEDVKNVYLNSFCFGFRLNSFNEMLPEFARFLFRSKVVRNEIKKLAQGSTRYNMSKTELLKLEILLPSIKEQKEISALLSSLDQKIQTEKSILEQLEMQKKYLLQQMFV